MAVRFRIWGTLGVAASLAVVLVSGQEPAVPGQQFRGGTDLVLVNVRVVDRNGQPVSDLAASDFEVKDEGKPMPVLVFEKRAFPHDVAGVGPTVLRRDEGAPDAAALGRRVFLLVLGRADMGRCVLNISPNCSFTSGIRDGIAGLREFVGKLGANDYVAVLAYNRLTDFTTSHSAIRDIIDRYDAANRKIETDLVFVETGLAARFGSGEPHPRTQALIDGIFDGVDPLAVRRLAPVRGPDAQKMLARQRELFRMMEEAALPSSGPAAANVLELLRASEPDSSPTPGRDETSPSDDTTTSYTIRGLKDAGYIYAGIDALRPVAGEKHLVFMSPGGIGMGGDAGRHLAEVASDARIAVHLIHTGGVSASSIGLADDSRRLAQTTGGSFEANRFKTAAVDLQRILDSTGFEYLIGYERPPTSGSTAFRNIQVTVKRAGVAVNYRRGYFSPTSTSEQEIRATLKYDRVAAAAEYVKEIDDIPFASSLTMRLNPRRADVTIRLDVSRIAFVRSPTGRNTATLEVAVFCLSSRQRPVGDRWHTVELDLSDARRDELQASGGIPVSFEVPLTAAAESAKVVVYDYGADLLGSRNVKVERP